MESSEPTRLSSTLADHASSMRAHLDQCSMARAELRSQLASLDEEIHRLTGAVAVLEGTVAVKLPVTPATPERKARGGSAKSPLPRHVRKRAYRPRQASLDAVAAFVESKGNGGTTREEILANVKISVETLQRALLVLRTEERIRKAGVIKNGSGRRQVYKPMPQTSAALVIGEAVETVPAGFRVDGD